MAKALAEYPSQTHRCQCGVMVWRSSQQCRACYTAQRRQNRALTKQWQNYCKCGKPKAKSSTQCGECRSGAGHMVNTYQTRGGLRVRPDAGPMVEDFQRFLMTQRTRIRQSTTRAVSRVNKAKAEMEEIATQARLAGTTLARSTRAVTMSVEVRGNASGHAMGRRSPLLAEERMPGSAEVGVTMRYGPKEANTLVNR